MFPLLGDLVQACDGVPQPFVTFTALSLSFLATATLSFIMQFEGGTFVASI